MPLAPTKLPLHHDEGRDKTCSNTSGNHVERGDFSQIGSICPGIMVKWNHHLVFLQPSRFVCSPIWRKGGCVCVFRFFSKRSVNISFKVNIIEWPWKSLVATCFLLEKVDFHCHVSLLEGIFTYIQLNGSLSKPDHPMFANISSWKA